MEQEIKEQKIKKKFDVNQLFILIQTGICTLFVSVLLVLKSLNPEIYNIIKSWYLENINNSLIISEEIENNSELDAKYVTSKKLEEINKKLTEENKKQESIKIDNNKKNLEHISVYSDMITNGLILPVSSGRVTSKFGMRKDPFTGEMRGHSGLDIGADKNDKIFATLSGKVEVAEYESSYGNYIIINHGGNIKTLYAHCSKLLVKEGQEVKQNEVIALVGSTGRSTGCHLHFEVRINGQRQDPEQFLGKRYV